MNIVSGIAAALVLGIALAGLAGCEQEGPAERAGKAIDNAAEQAGEKIEKAGEKIRDAVED